MNLALVIQAVQSKLGLVPVDGIAGPATWRAIHLAVVGKPYESVEPTVPLLADRVDARSEKNISTLLTSVRPYARALVHTAEAQGISIQVISGTRTYEEQDALYAQRPKVTNARGGYSNHNFGIAFDIGIFRDGKYIPESPLYKAVGALGKSLGLSWGGDWTSIIDEPHFEFNPKGYTLAQLRDIKAAGQLA